MRKIIFILFILIVPCLLLLDPSYIYSKDFSSIYKTTYEFNSQGVASVTQEVSLINNSPDLYPSQYILRLIGTNIFGIEAYDNIGPIKSEIKEDKDGVTISLKFNEASVGQGKVLSFILKYKSKEYAKTEGNLWNIVLPKLSNTKIIDEYSLVLKVPLSLGSLSNINPAPEKKEEDKKFKYYYFNKKNIEDYGVFATFGQYQTFNFSINYYLDNPNEEINIYQVPIPPETNYQHLYYSKIEPKPIDVDIDQDGNWIASFLVNPKEAIEVNAEGYVNIFSSPIKGYIANDNILEKYLLPSKYWLVDNPEIVALAEKLKKPENIYQYLVKNFKYNYELVGKNNFRRNSIQTIKDPENCVCSDFSDLFVSIARAASIPAREIQGYAYTDNPKLKDVYENSDVLHSWPEYYDNKSKQWTMVDPTYGNTTNGLDFFNQFDMTHFVFVIHGINSEIPIPPGSYKSEFNKKKQISISFGKENTNKKFDVKFISKFQNYIFSLIKNNVTLKIVNNSGELINKSILKLSADADIFPNQINLENLPPFGVIESSYSLKAKDFWRDYEITVEYALGEHIYEEKIIIRSILFRIAILTGLIISLILLILLRSVLKTKKLQNKIKNDTLLIK